MKLTRSKKWAIGILVAALATFGACQRSGRIDWKVDADIQERTLKNGLKIILVEDEKVPLVSFQSWYRVGSVDERPGITGISHLFEHLMFKGTEKYGPKSFFSELEIKGAEVNAYTTRDYTVYYETLSPQYLERAIEMEADRLANVKFDRVALLIEKQVVLEERKLRTDNTPSGRMQEELWRLAFPGHPYSWPVIGNAGDLASITVADLNDYFVKHYSPSNLVLVIAGKFSSGEVMDWIKKYYGSIESHPRHSREIPDAEPLTKETRVRMVDQVASQEFLYGYRICKAGDPDAYALDVLMNILFSGSSSMARKRLIEEANVASQVGGMAYTPVFPGLFTMAVSMRPGQSAKLGQDLLDDVLEKVRNEGVSEEQTKIAIRQLKMELLDGIRTPKGLAQLLGLIEIVFDGKTEINDEIRRYDLVKPEQVQEVARKYLRKDARIVIEMIPAGGES